MARPKGPEQRVPVKMRVNIGLMDRLRQLAAENRYSVPKMLTVIMEETLADLRTMNFMKWLRSTP